MGVKMYLIKFLFCGGWVALSVKCPTFDFSSGYYDLMVVLGSVLDTEPA